MSGPESGRRPELRNTTRNSDGNDGRTEGGFRARDGGRLRGRGARRTMKDATAIAPVYPSGLPAEIRERLTGGC